MLIESETLKAALIFNDKTGEITVPNMREVFRVIDSQPPFNPWHRVELEEPTKAGWYLVMDEDGDFNVDEWHNTFGWQFVTPSDADRITYWMPIEPPKEE